MRKKFEKAIAACERALLGRDEMVRLAWTVLVANENMSLLGEPGTAKSLLVNNLFRCFADSEHYTQLLSKYALPEALFGPMDLLKLKAGYQTRRTEGYMPSATSAFLDEGYKAGDGLLNSLLTLMNEREFDVGQNGPGEPSGRVLTRLGSTFIASNEVPEGTALDALWDRSIIKVWLVGLNKSPDMTRDILRMAADYPIRTVDRRRSRNVVSLDPSDKLSLEDLDAAQAEAQELPIAPGALDAVCNIVADMNSTSELGALVSDRTLARIWSVPRAVAWLDGATEVQGDHCEVLQHCFWRDPAQRKALREVVFKHANPLTDTVRSIVDRMQETMNASWPHAEFAADDDASQLRGQRAALRLIRELEQHVIRLKGLVDGKAKYRIDVVNAEEIVAKAHRQVAEATRAALERQSRD